MPNPWDRQPRESVWLSEHAELPCPCCGAATNSLKQYRYISQVFCYIIDFTYETAYYRACPHCMRSLILRRLAWTVIPGNVVWFLLVLPWGIGLIVATYRIGHSQDVIRQVTPEMIAKQMAASEFSWGRIVAVVAVLCFWFPLIGLGVAFGAWLVNRKSVERRRTVSRIALALSILIHLAIVVLLALSA